jgi:hypothetical protein
VRREINDLFLPSALAENLQDALKPGVLCL